MSVNEKDLKLLWERSGGICAFPGCNEELTCRTTNDIIGQMCHIIGKKAGGPRGKKAIPLNKLDKYENFILLCPTHHVIIDNDEQAYTVERLRQMKEEHEKREFARRQQGRPWDCNISQLTYINIPRLAILAGLMGIQIDWSGVDKKPNLHSFGWDLNYIMLSIERMLNKIHPHVIKLETLKTFDETHIGATLSFVGNFRTKGVPYPDYAEKGKKLYIGDLERGPQIYIKKEKWKVILPIDPKWITTSTAFAELTRGVTYVAGLCMIKQIDKAKGQIVATPLVIGPPKSAWDNFC